jgi:hypothetical protein
LGRADGSLRRDKHITLSCALKIYAKKIYASGIGMLKNMSLFPRIWEVNESIPHTEKIATLEKHCEELGCSEGVRIKPYL